jgi:hypothetical protein
MKKPWKFHVGLLLSLAGLLVWQQQRVSTDSPRVSPDSLPASPPIHPPSSPGGANVSPVSGIVPQADVFGRFSEWKNNKPKSVTQRGEWIKQGIELATSRNRILAELARKQPERAAPRLMSLAELADLPDEVRALSEQPLNGTGSIELVRRPPSFTQFPALLSRSCIHSTLNNFFITVASPSSP